MAKLILIVASEADIAESLKALVNTLPDVAVSRVGSYAEAVHSLGESPWDLVIADQRLPDGTGVTLLRLCRELRPQAKRVIVTGYGDYDAAARAINEARVDQFVQKPWDPEVLRGVLEGLLWPAAPGEGGSGRIPPSPGAWPPGKR